MKFEIPRINLQDITRNTLHSRGKTAGTALSERDTFFSEHKIDSKNWVNLRRNVKNVVKLASED